MIDGTDSKGENSVIFVYFLRVLLNSTSDVSQSSSPVVLKFVFTYLNIGAHRGATVKFSNDLAPFSTNLSSC